MACNMYMPNYRLRISADSTSKFSFQKPLCRLTEFKDTAEYIGSFLEAPDLANLCQASKDSLLLFSKNLPTMELLKAVFDADPKQVKKILRKPRTPKSKCIVLTKTHIKETYFSQKLNKTGCKRKWSNISPLEAAAWCGDIFLVRALLFQVPPTQKQEACDQLKGILERKESEQNGTYLAPYKALIQAYETYKGQRRTFYTAENYDEIDKLFSEVWQKQRLLPTYGLQEYCDDKPFHSLSYFTDPPRRSFCYLHKVPYLFKDPGKRLLDLDTMDFGWVLYKGDGPVAAAPGGLDPKRGFCVDSDIAAISRLCEVRTIELDNIIKELERIQLLEESGFEEDKDVSAQP